MVLLQGYSDRLFESEGWSIRLCIGCASSPEEWDRERDKKQRKSSSAHLYLPVLEKMRYRRCQNRVHLRVEMQVEPLGHCEGGRGSPEGGWRAGEPKGGAGGGNRGGGSDSLRGPQGGVASPLQELSLHYGNGLAAEIDALSAQTEAHFTTARACLKGKHLFFAQLLSPVRG